MAAHADGRLVFASSLRCGAGAVFLSRGTGSVQHFHAGALHDLRRADRARGGRVCVVSLISLDDGACGAHFSEVGVWVARIVVDRPVVEAVDYTLRQDVVHVVDVVVVNIVVVDDIVYVVNVVDVVNIVNVVHVVNIVVVDSVSSGGASVGRACGHL